MIIYLLIQKPNGGFSEITQNATKQCYWYDLSTQINPLRKLGIEYKICAYWYSFCGGLPTENIQ